MNVLDANEIRHLRTELAARDAEIARLRGWLEKANRALGDMIDLAEEGSRYKGGYLAEKHGDAETIAEARTVVDLVPRAARRTGNG